MFKTLLFAGLMAVALAAPSPVPAPAPAPAPAPSPIGSAALITGPLSAAPLTPILQNIGAPLLYSAPYPYVNYASSSPYIYKNYIF
ncbi:neuropeptide-like 3 [Ceratina calcarata]|uniref:Neuropeptide-like 3 n=1 Tax=Ceratina calcarata TaxID=156304 RepID=A0AAJ7S575_9HYME|nr:neuropeptide-like 3 [Ceratina calcarata]